MGRLFMILALLTLAVLIVAPVGVSAAGKAERGCAGLGCAWSWDGSKAVLPLDSQSEGIARDKMGNLFVTGTCVEDSTGKVIPVVVMIDRCGNKSHFADLPLSVSSYDYMCGLTCDSRGNIFVAYTSFSGAGNTGIYRVDRCTKQVTLFADNANMFYPNDVVFDECGNLFISDSASGIIFKKDKGTASSDPTVSIFAASPMLTTTNNHCGFGTIGANGLAFDGKDNLYVANTGDGAVIKVDKKGVCRYFVAPNYDPDMSKFGLLEGIDGIIFGDCGVLYAAVNAQNKVVAINRGGRVSEVCSGLAFPASLEMGFDRNILYVTCPDFLNWTSPSPTVTAIFVGGPIH